MTRPPDPQCHFTPPDSLPAIAPDSHSGTDPLLSSLALSAARGVLAVADGAVRIARQRLMASLLANEPVGLIDIEAQTYILAAAQRRRAQGALDALAPPPHAGLGASSMDRRFRL